MNWIERKPWQRLRQSLSLPSMEGGEQAARIHAFQKDVVLPIKAFVVLILIYYFYFSHWFREAETTQEVPFETIRSLFVVYLLLNGVMAAVFFSFRRLSLAALQWTIFTVGLLDALLFASLILVTGGFDSVVYWVFLGLILHNSLSIPLATPQIGLNLAVCLLYLAAGTAERHLGMREESTMTSMPPPLGMSYQERHKNRQDAAGTNSIPVAPIRPPPATRRNAEASESDDPSESLRLVILLLMSACCYGLQALIEKQRRAEAEAEEFAMRQNQLEASGRLAAEIAHQIKNPLGIINMAAYSLHKALVHREPSVVEQIDIIREEVGRADRIITELMGYAQLAEGRVERLNVAEEFDRALAQAFPTGARYAVEIERDYAPALPSLLMQRGHLSEILVNLLQNAREAMNGVGRVRASARYGENYTVILTVSDTGSGVPPAMRERIFEPYFTTKKKGTGLGLAIVKHNAEIYGGTARVESELGKGAAFIIELPAKALMRLNR